MHINGKEVIIIKDHNGNNKDNNIINIYNNNNNKAYILQTVILRTGRVIKKPFKI